MSPYLPQLKAVVQTTIHTPGASLVVLVLGASALAAGGVWSRTKRPTAAAIVAIVALLLPLAYLCSMSGTRRAGVAAAAVLALSWLVGSAVVRLTSGPELHPLERLVMAVGYGLGIIGFLVFAIGLPGWLHPRLVLLLGAALGVGALVLLLRRGETTLTISATDRWLPRDSLLATGAALLIEVILPYIPSPELVYDAVYYHLTIVGEFVSHRAVIQLPNLFASNFPVFPHLVYTAAALFSSIAAPKYVNFAVGLITALTIYAVGARLKGRVAGLLAAVCWLSMPLVLWEMSTSMVDLFMALFAALAILAAYVWVDTRRSVYMLAMAIFVGLGFGIKPNMAFVAAPLFLAFAIFHVRQRRDIVVWLISGVIAVVIAAPWYVRSFLLTGNPFFPFLNGVFRSPLWEPVNEQFNFDLFGMGRDPMALLLLPWRLTLHTSKFAEVPDGALGAVPMLIASALLVVVVRRDRRTAPLAVFLLLGVVSWFGYVQYARYLLPVLSAGAVLVGYCGALLIGDRGIRWRNALGTSAAGASVALCLVVLPSLFGNVPGGVPWAPDLSEQTRNAYLSGALRHFAAYQWMRSHLPNPADANIIGFGLSEWPIAYSPARISISYFTLPGHRVQSASTPEEVTTALKAGGFDYVILDNFPRNHWTDQFVVAQPPFMNAHLRLIYANNYVYLYHVEDHPEQPVSSESLQDPDFQNLTNAQAGPWQRIGAGSDPGTERCAGVSVDPADGYFQEFMARPNHLYTFTYQMAGADASANGKLQVNWLGPAGQANTNIEIDPVSSVPESYSMSSTSPDWADHGIVYVTGFGPAHVCVQAVRVTDIDSTGNAQALDSGSR